MELFLQPLLQAGRVSREIRVGNGEVCEAEFSPAVRDLLFECLQVRQGHSRIITAAFARESFVVLYTSLLYTAAQTRELDRLAIQGLPDGEPGVPGIVLMKRAGRAALDILQECWPRPEVITVYCGSGNNGGDGYILAALAQERGLPVAVVEVGDAGQRRGDAKLARDFALATGVPFQSLDTAAPANGVIVDALLGTGLAGAARSPCREAIQSINASGLPVLAIDIPSGLDSDTGAIAGGAQGVAVKADLTVSFIALKRGLFTACGPEHCGEIFYDDLEVAPAIFESVQGEVSRLDLDEERLHLPARKRDAHKGVFGHVLVIGGEQGYGGAALMAAETAARCGAGLVSVATRACHVSGMLARRPELMVHAVDNHHALEPLLAKASVIVLGPGLGREPWAEQLFYHALQYTAAHDVPVVLDADALYLLTEKRLIKTWPARCVLTPHPGEAAHLLGCGVDAVSSDRFAAVQQLATAFRATVVLKGAGTLVASGTSLALCAYGNPGMASGGMGDVLSGVIAALLAQKFSLCDAAQLGVCVHAAAADELAQAEGERGLLATDLIPVIRRLLNPVIVT